MKITDDELFGEYIPDNKTIELCPKCASKIKIINFNDDAWGNPKDFIEKNCTNADCGWWKIE